MYKIQKIDFLKEPDKLKNEDKEQPKMRTNFTGYKFWL